MLMQQHFVQLLHLLKMQNICCQRQHCFCGVVVTVVVATARCTWIATSTEFKHELNNLPLTETRFLLGKKFL